MKVHNKEESCEDCPDRTIDPNCHETCEGYIKRQAKQEKIKEERRKNFEYCQYRDEPLRKRKKVGEL